MVLRTSRGEVVDENQEIAKKCTVCKATENLIRIDMSNGHAIFFSGYFCNWEEYSKWKKTFDVERKKLLEGQEEFG